YILRSSGHERASEDIRAFIKGDHVEPVLGMEIVEAKLHGCLRLIHLAVGLHRSGAIQDENDLLRQYPLLGHAKSWRRNEDKVAITVTTLVIEQRQSHLIAAGAVEQ